MLTARTSPDSATWTGEHVRMRLVEAFQIERRLPGQRFAAIAVASAWPGSPVSSFEDVLHWGAEARERVWESWERSKGTFPYEVTRMEDAFSWLQYLPDGERRCLSAWALASARSISVRAMLDKRRWSRTTFYRRVYDASGRIADRLNAQGVVVR